MPVTVNVNGLSLVHKGSEGVSEADVPDICLTPPDMKPVEYENVSYSKDLRKGTKTITADGGQMTANLGSEFCKSTGDEIGSGGGITSGVHMKESTWLSYSQDVRMEGQPACRYTDQKLHNHGNTLNNAGETQKELPDKERDDDCPYDWKDGDVIGSDGKGGCAPMDSEKEKPVTPLGRSQYAKGKVVFINGINNDECAHCESLNAIAEHLCTNVVGVYNRSGLFEAAIDKINLGDYKAGKTLENMVYDHMKNGQSIHIMAHSHGAEVTRRALTQVNNRILMEGGNGLSSSIRVSTFGGSGWTFPSGPQYSHMVHILDVVPMFFGQGAPLLLPLLGRNSEKAKPLLMALAFQRLLVEGLLHEKVKFVFDFVFKKGFPFHSFKYNYLSKLPKVPCGPSAKIAKV